MSIPSTLVSAESAAGKDDLWDLSSLFIANWVTNVEIADAWLTDVVSSKSVSESRICRLSKPYRTIGFNITTLEKSATTLVHSMMLRAGMARSLLPLYPDVGKLVSQANSGSVSILIDDATYKRFFNNGRVAICTPRQDARILSWEIKTVAVVVPSGGNTSINFTTNLANTWAAGSRVYPLIEAELVFNSRAAVITDDKLSGSMTFRETVGNPGLPALVTPGTVPIGWPVHSDGLPIFNLPIDWEGISIGSQRAGASAPVGVDTYNEAYGTYPMGTWDVSMTKLSRASAWDVLRFFDSRGGRAFPFWFVSPVSNFDVVNISGTSITVKAIGPEYDWNFRPYLAFVGRDGTCQVRHVTGHSRSGPNDVLTIDSVIAYSLTTLRRCSVSKISRFSSDELIETWITPSIMRTNLPIIEVTDKAVNTEFNDTSGCNSLMPDPEDTETETPKFFQFRQAHGCQDGALVDAWLRVTDIPYLPFFIKTKGECVPNACVFFLNDGRPKTSHGKLIDDFDVMESCIPCDDCPEPPCYDCEQPPCEECVDCNEFVGVTQPNGCVAQRTLKVRGFTGGSSIFNGDHLVTWNQTEGCYIKGNSAPGAGTVWKVFCGVVPGPVYKWQAAMDENLIPDTWFYQVSVAKGTACCPPANLLFTDFDTGNYSGAPTVELL